MYFRFPILIPSMGTLSQIFIKHHTAPKTKKLLALGTQASVHSLWKLSIPAGSMSMVNMRGRLLYILLLKGLIYPFMTWNTCFCPYQCSRVDIGLNSSPEPLSREHWANQWLLSAISTSVSRTHSKFIFPFHATISTFVIPSWPPRPAISVFVGACFQ